MTLGRRADAAARRFGASVACAGSAFFGCASSAPVGARQASAFPFQPSHLADYGPSHRTRHTAPQHDSSAELGHGYASNTWQIDVYEGLLKGVVLAEIELTDADQKLTLPDWIGEGGDRRSNV
jgi:hypothetical protein